MRSPQLAAFAAALVLSLTGAAGASATTFHAAPDATRSATPCTAAAPCALHYALGQAFDGDDVLLAAGTYDHHRTDPLEVRPGVRLLGTPGVKRPLIAQTVPYRDCAGCVVIGLRARSVLRDVDVSQVEGGGAVRAVAEATIERSALRGRSTALRLEPWVLPEPAGGVRDVLAVADDGVAIVAGGGTTHQLEHVTAIGRGTYGVGISVRSSAGVDTTVDAVNTIARGDVYDVEGAAGSTAGFEDVATLKLRYSNFREDRVNRAPSDPAWSNGRVETWDQNQHGDPKFASANDFHLADGSPSIDAGRLNGLSGTLDLDGQPRSYGEGPDIGAYEKGAATPPPERPDPKPRDDKDAGPRAPGPRRGDDQVPPPPTPFTGLTVPNQTIAVKRNAARLKVRCPEGQSGECTGRVTLRKGKAPIGSARFSVRRGAAARVRVKLNKRGRKMIARKRKLKAVAHVITSNAQGDRATARARITLKLAQKRKARR